jgi:hypothetical protein
MRLLPAAAVLLVRVALVLAVGRPGSPGWEGRILYSDSHSYLHAAGDLADGRQDEPHFRTPGYPLLLDATSGGGGGWTLTILLQQAADFACAASVSAMALPFIGPAGAGLAALVLMLLPSGIIYSAYLIPDILVALAAALSGLLWTRLDPAAGTRRAVLQGLAAGLCLSAGLLLKPVAAAAPAVYFALVAMPGPGRAARLIFAAALTVPCLAVYMALRAFNLAAFGLPGLTTQDALEPLGRAVAITDYRGMSDDIDGFWLFEDSLERLAVRNGSLDYGLRDSIYRAETGRILLSAPLRALIVETTRWPKFFANFDGHIPYPGVPPDPRKPVWWWLPTSIPHLLVGVSLASAILLPAVRRGMDRLFWLGLAWFLVWIPLTGPNSSFRYGLMFYWALAPFAAALALHATGRLARRAA